MSNQTVAFLATVKPFDLLSEDELQKTAQNLSQNNYTSDKILFVQNKTFLNQVYIVAEGRLEKYIQEQGRKDLSEVLEAGNIYGGLSTLFNRSLSIRTVKTLEKSTLYSLPREHFLDLCSRYPDFIQYFTGQYCSQMLHRPYMSFLARSAKTQDLRAAQGFLNLALHDIYSRDFAFCSQDLSIQKAAGIMSEKKRSSIVIMNDRGQSVGLLTDNDLRKKVVSMNYPVHHPVKDIDSRPLITLSPRAHVFEAILKMMRYNIKHLVITDDQTNILGVATEQDLLLAQGKSPVYLMREIQLSHGVSELKVRYEQLPGLIKSLMDSGARAGDLNRIITEISDAVLKKIALSVLEEEGDSPVRFSFLVMGSDGRMEQTLKTDQDNALVYEDVDPGLEKETRAYFLRLGDRICTRLDEVGFSFCKFKVMAGNPKWCQPLSVWKKYFWDWIHKAEPMDLLHSCIFFDFRTGYGEQSITDDLKDYLFRTLGDWKGFFRHLAENSLRFKPPLDIFGNLVLKKINGRKNCLDIKQPMQILVDFARVYALQHKIPDTNTLDRLQRLHQMGVLDKHDYDELVHAYSFMMLMRLSHQVDMLAGGDKPANNYILPGDLTYIHRQSLKEAFKGIRNAQGRMRMDLTQDIGIT
jgi:CBS domain-containing protein